MKGSSMNTHMGNIVINNEVIAQYAGSVAVECFGIVGMAGVSMKDGILGDNFVVYHNVAHMCIHRRTLHA